MDRLFLAPIFMNTLSNDQLYSHFMVTYMSVILSSKIHFALYIVYQKFDFYITVIKTMYLCGPSLLVFICSPLITINVALTLWHETYYWTNHSKQSR